MNWTVPFSGTVCMDGITARSFSLACTSTSTIDDTLWLCLLKMLTVKV